MVGVSSWLDNRSGFSDWPTPYQTRERKLVNLSWLSNSSGSLAAHPGVMAHLRFCVGFQTLGGILINVEESHYSGFSDAAPAAVDGQWLAEREQLSDWSADHRTPDQKLVSLEHQNEGYVAHPLHFAMLRFCVGLVRLGGTLYPDPDSRYTQFFTPNEPVAVGGQWLVHRGLLSDWPTSEQTREDRLVSLDNQLEGFAAHPLPFGMLRRVTGLIRLGGCSYPDVTSRTTIATAEEDLLLDALSTEELSILITEDTGEPIGLG